MERRLRTRNETVLPVSLLLIFFLAFLLSSSNAALSSYTFTSVAGGYALEDTVSSTQLIGTNADNTVAGVSAVTPIGFTFSLNGTPYTQFSVNENGLLRLGSTVVSTGSTTANSLNGSSTDLPRITAYFDDMKTTTGTVRYKVVGSAPNRKLVIQWNVTIINPNSLNSKFQVWLYETSNNIAFVYGQNMVANAGQYSAGMVGTVTTDFQSINASTNVSSTSTVTNNNTVALASGKAYLFEVAPGCSTTPSPAASATNVSVNPTLSWTAGTGTSAGYDIYFGTVNPPSRVAYNQAANNYTPATLNPNTTYYWKVNPRNDSAAANCTVNQFTTMSPPACPNIVSPASGATNVSYYNCVLTWSSGSTTTTSYDVYFGTTNNPPLVSTAQAGTTYNAGVLSANTTYYWKVIGRNGTLTSTSCSVIQFTTAQKINFDVARTTGISYSSISATGNTIPSWKNGMNTDDNLSNAVPIGFNFNYGGNNYSNFLVSTNGFITFNTATSTLGQSSTPYGYTDDALSNFYPTPSVLTIAPFYYDMVCQGNPGTIAGLNQCIHYSLDGSAGSRVLTIEWKNMELYITAGPDFNFQVKLYEGSNKIDFVYGTMEGFNGTFNTSYSYSVGLNSAVMSSPPVAGEVFNQLTPNTRNFGVTPSNGQNMIPDCNSMLTFTPGNYTAYVPVSGIPVNDNSANAIVLPVNSTPCISLCGTIYSSANATYSGITGCSATSADDDVWFKFTANSTSSTTIKLISSGNYDGTIELFNNSMTSIGCANATSAGMIESLTMNLTNGQNYFIRVFHRFSGWGGAVSSGQFSICVTATPPPPTNDDCINNINLTVNQNPVFIQGTSTYSATASAGVPGCSLAGTNPDDDVWYSFTAINTQEIITVAGGTGFDAVVQLFSGNCNALTPVACVDAVHNGQTETLTATNLTRNAVYYVRVYHEGVGGGTGNYSIAVSSPAPTCVQAMAPNNGDVDIPTFGQDLFWDSVPEADNYRIVLDTIFPPVHVLGITTDFTINTGPLLGGKTYYWRVEAGNASGYNTSCQVFHFTAENTPIGLTVRVFLEGYYTGNQTMLPLVNPLDTLTDTVTISLADSLGDIYFTQNAFLSTHGWATAHFPLGVYEQYWYIIINQRNGLEIWTPQTLGLFTTDTVYDFTTAASQAAGSNQKQLGPGVFGMHTGDVNQDGAINLLDIDTLMDDVHLFESDILLGDLNGDGFAESIDYSFLENKIGLNLSVVYPF